MTQHKSKSPWADLIIYTVLVSLILLLSTGLLGEYLRHAILT